MKKIMSYSLFGFVIIVISSYLTIFFINKRKDISYANVLLFEIKYEIELLNLCHKNPAENKELIRKIEEMLFRKMLLISDINPSIDDLKGTPLDSLVQVVNYNKHYKILYTGPYYSQSVLNYLKLIEETLIKEEEYMKRIKTEALMEFYGNQKMN
jgi:hypothetical protein